MEYDGMRSRFLESRGDPVVRFWNAEVLFNIQGVMDKILLLLEAWPLHSTLIPNPSPILGEGSFFRALIRLLNALLIT